jgi:lysophospholipase L1-like esterase
VTAHPRRGAVSTRLRGQAGEVRLPTILGAGIGLVVVVVLAIRIASLTGVLDDKPDDRPRVLILGDSITDRGQRFLHDELDASYALSIDGKASFRIDQQLPSAQRWSTRPFSQVVINLGTNDADQGWPTEQSAEALTTMVGLFPQATCIHLVTINEQLPDLHGRNPAATAKALNTVIRQLSAGNPRVRMVDFDGIVRERRQRGVEDPTIDGVHPTDETHQLLAEAIRESLDTCNATTDTTI